MIAISFSLEDRKFAGLRRTKLHSGRVVFDPGVN